jgi:hypothetical protein
MVYNDTTTRQGIIQAEEGYCELGAGGITGNATLLLDFLRYNNTALAKIWSWIIEASGGTYDDGNQTNLPSAAQDLTINTSTYALPTAALAVTGIEIYDANGVPTKLTATSMQQEQLNGALGDFGRLAGIPSRYMILGSTVKLDTQPPATVTNGFKVYFERGSVAFASGATSAAPGFASEFHEAVAVGGSLPYLKVHKPNSAVLSRLLLDWDGNEDATGREGGFKKAIKNFYRYRMKELTQQIKMEPVNFM